MKRRDRFVGGKQVKGPDPEARPNSSSSGSEPSRLMALRALRSAQSLYRKLGEAVAGELVCGVCKRREPCDGRRAAACLASGWPSCCGQPMTLEKQLSLFGGPK
jgi:hypothetical protein